MAHCANPQPYPGAPLARQCLIRITRLNRQAARQGSEADPQAVALVLLPYLAAPPGFALALGEFLAAALEGCVIDPQRWQPLAALEGGAA